MSHSQKKLFSRRSLSDTRNDIEKKVFFLSSKLEDAVKRTKSYSSKQSFSFVIAFWEGKVILTDMADAMN